MGVGRCARLPSPLPDRVSETVHRGRTVWTMAGTRLVLVCPGDEGVRTVLVILVFAVKTTFGFTGPKTKSKVSEAACEFPRFPFTFTRCPSAPRHSEAPKPQAGRWAVGQKRGDGTQGSRADKGSGKKVA